MTTRKLAARCQKSSGKPLRVAARAVCGWTSLVMLQSSQRKLERPPELRIASNSDTAPRKQWQTDREILEARGSTDEILSWLGGIVNSAYLYDGMLRFAFAGFALRDFNLCF